MAQGTVAVYSCRAAEDGGMLVQAGSGSGCAQQHKQHVVAEACRFVVSAAAGCLVSQCCSVRVPAS